MSSESEFAEDFETESRRHLCLLAEPDFLEIANESDWDGTEQETEDGK